MIFNGFNISLQGFSHIVNDVVCQDSSAYYSNEYIAIAVVADGHGSSKHFRSDIGSKIAVDTALNSIKEFMKDLNAFNIAIETNNNKVLKRIESNIVYNWNNSVNEHYKNNPLTESEKSKIPEAIWKTINIETMYGSTLIAAILTSKYWFGIQIGDGNCVCVYEDGQTKSLIPEDNRLVANFTTSLCDSDAINNFRQYYSTEIPIAVLVSTDGLSTSFFDESSFFAFNRRIILEIGSCNMIENLKEHLNKRSKEGSLDDISIATIYNFNELKAAHPVINIQ